jgi:hypothetical protein
LTARGRRQACIGPVSGCDCSKCEVAAAAAAARGGDAVDIFGVVLAEPDEDFDVQLRDPTGGGMSGHVHVSSLVAVNAQREPQRHWRVGPGGNQPTTLLGRVVGELVDAGAAGAAGTLFHSYSSS